MSRNGTAALERPPRLPDGAPLDYAPNNEQGVVYLFSHLARRRFGLHVEKVQAGFPDCIAYRQGKRIRIEFEYRSRNFCLHRHPMMGCDWIVCWIHDWPSAPTHLRVVELRREFGLGFNVWFQSIGVPSTQDINHVTRHEQWSVPGNASEGDLILFYRARPESCVRDIFRICGTVREQRAGWRPGLDLMSSIRLVSRLKAPLHLSDLKAHPVLRNAGFVRGSMQGRRRASEYWPELHRMIIARNPGAIKELARFGPERLW